MRVPGLQTSESSARKAQIMTQPIGLPVNITVLPELPYQSQEDGKPVHCLQFHGGLLVSRELADSLAKLPVKTRSLLAFDSKRRRTKGTTKQQRQSGGTDRERSRIERKALVLICGLHDVTHENIANEVTALWRGFPFTVRIPRRMRGKWYQLIGVKLAVRNKR